MKKRFPYLIILLTLVSCQREKEVGIDVPQESKLVAVVYAGADNSSVVATVTHSTPVIGTSQTYEATYADNASGTFTDLSTSEAWNFTYDQDTRLYTANLSTTTIQEGHQYELRFSDDKETVTGTTTVPLPVATHISVLFDSIVTDGFVDQYKATITCTLLSEGTQNIRLAPVILYNDSFPFPMTDQFGTQFVFQLSKGQSFTQTFTSSYSLGAESYYPTQLEIMVLSCDDAYRKYYNSTGLNYDQLGPISDPTFVYSNMSNKIGVIASYNISETLNIELH